MTVIIENQNLRMMDQIGVKVEHITNSLGESCADIWIYRVDATCVPFSLRLTCVDWWHFDWLDQNMELADFSGNLILYAGLHKEPLNSA